MIIILYKYNLYFTVMNSNSKQPRPEYKSDKCEVSGRYFVVGCQIAGCRHILTGLFTLALFLEIGSKCLDLHVKGRSMLDVKIECPSTVIRFNHGRK